MSLHTFRDEGEWHESPFDPDETLQERVFEWQATCSCGWAGPWRSTGKTSRYVGPHIRTDYRQHVEAELGAQAYYDAPVRCTNCASVHTQPILVGTRVRDDGCIRCGTTHNLRPDNEAYIEEEERTKGWKW